MNILFIADNFPPERNAQASRVYERACYWVRWGHQLTVLTCFPNFPEGKLFPGYRNSMRKVEEISGIRVVRVKTFIAPNVGTVLRILDYLSFMISSFLAGLFVPRPDVVVTTSPQFFAAIAGCALAAVRGLPFVLEISDLWPDSIVAVGAMKRNLPLRWLEKLELLLYRRAARIVVLTPAFRDNLVRRGVPTDKIDVVINGVDLERYRPKPKDPAMIEEWGLGNSRFVVGYIGTHGMAHALENVLAAAALVKDPDITFMFVGTGAMRTRLVEEAERSNLRNVRFVPAQAKETMPTMWAICDVALVHLSNTPLFRTVIPSKLFEAMAMGLPILLTAPEGQASSIVDSEGAGLCVPAEDPQALADAVQLLSENRSLLRQLADRSTAAAPRYSRERQARDMLSSLEAAIGAGPKPIERWAGGWVGSPSPQPNVSPEQNCSTVDL
jgi:glycosyltransferase involved in cell wall biosynthesis